MVNGRGVTIRLVLLVGLVATLFAYLVLRIWTGQGGALPPSSWGALVVLVFMACWVFFAARPVRRFLRGQARKPLNPIRAMRTVVLAQASALTGALVAGWYLAQILLLVGDLDVASQRSLALRLAAFALLTELHGIEADHGRVRETRWGARSLDLDLIQYGDPGSDSDLVSDDPELTLPHPRARERAFVLAPWASVDAQALLRVGDAATPVGELLGQADLGDGDDLDHSTYGDSGGTGAGVRPGPDWSPSW